MSTSKRAALIMRRLYAEPFIRRVGDEQIIEKNRWSVFDKRTHQERYVLTLYGGEMFMAQRMRHEATTAGPRGIFATDSFARLLAILTF
jgi:hypothetical protein